MHIFFWVPVFLLRVYVVEKQTQKVSYVHVS